MTLMIWLWGGLKLYKSSGIVEDKFWSVMDLKVTGCIKDRIYGPERGVKARMEQEFPNSNSKPTLHWSESNFLSFYCRVAVRIASKVVQALNLPSLSVRYRKLSSLFVSMIQNHFNYGPFDSGA